MIIETDTKEKGPEVICVGDLNLDIVFSAPFLSKPGEEVKVKDLDFSPGGSAANVAVILSRLGIRVGLISAVGQDIVGELLLKDLINEGVDVSNVVKISSVPTGTILILVDDLGERTMYAYRGANVMIQPNHVNEEYLKSCKMIHLSGYSLLEGSQRLATLKAIDVALSKGLKLSLDTNVMLAQKGMDYIQNILERLELLFVNEEEAKLLAGLEDPIKATEVLHAKGPIMSILKKGERGCTIFWRDKRMNFMTKARKALDTTGAGDAFVAGFIYGYLKRWETEKVASLANALGGVATTSLGARKGLPEKIDVEKLMSMQ